MDDYASQSSADAPTSFPGDTDQPPEYAGQSSAGSPTSYPGDTDPPSSQTDLGDYSTGPTLSDGEKEGLWTVGSHVVGELFDSTPVGIALHTLSMESDNPQAMEAQRDEEFNQQLQDQTDAQRSAAMTDALGSHTVAMDATAVPEQDEEVFQP